MAHDIDVHIIHPQSYTVQTSQWLDQCIGSLEHEPVNIHFVNYVRGDIRAARFSGFQQGSGRYVSFVDFDDWVEPGIFDVVLDQLSSRPDACGAFTLSNRVTQKDGSIINLGLLNEFSEWPMKQRGSLVDIHQLVVMDRDDCLSVYHRQYDDIPKIVHEMTWVYWEMARSKPWVPINRVGYNWRQHPNGAHLVRSDEVSESLSRSIQHMTEIRSMLANH